MRTTWDPQSQFRKCESEGPNASYHVTLVESHAERGTEHEHQRAAYITVSLPAASNIPTNLWATFCRALHRIIASLVLLIFHA